MVQSSRKQAFGGVLSRKEEECPPGFEPGNNGFANRYLVSPNPIGDRDLGTPGKPTVPSTVPLGKPSPGNLQEVVEAWDGLPDAIKAAVLALVAASIPVDPPPWGAVLSKRLNTWPRRPGANPKRIRGSRNLGITPSH